MNKGATPVLQNESGRCNEAWRNIRYLVVARGVPVLRQGQQPGDLYRMQREGGETEDPGAEMYAVRQACTLCRTGILL